MINEYFLAYMGIGLLYVCLEHLSWEYDLTDLSFTDKLLFTAQQSIHYVRVALVWWLYLLEDLVIFIDNHRS